MDLPIWFVWGVPLGALAFALAELAWLNYEGRKFDRKYGKRG